MGVRCGVVDPANPDVAGLPYLCICPPVSGVPEPPGFDGATPFGWVRLGSAQWIT